MAYKEIYVNPALASNTGTGTVGDPYGDLDYAIVQQTQGTVGTRLNIKRGVDEIVTRELGAAFADTSVRAAWAYSVNNPIVFQGYDTVAGDLAGTGNRAGISAGGASVMILNGASANNVAFIDLHLHNTGTSTAVVRVATGGIFIRCEVDNNTGRGIYTTSNSLIMGCYVHDISGAAIDTAGSVRGCIITNTGTKDCTTAVNLLAGASATQNIISIDGASDGIACTDRYNTIRNNSIYSNGGTGQAIFCTDVDGFTTDISNNLIEGFSGSGGVGILFAGTKPQLAVGGRNLIYNCATAVTLPGDYIATQDTYGLAALHEVLLASPFADAAGFDFSPVDTGNVKEGSEPATFMTI
jgi:hypothetical protein